MKIISANITEFGGLKNQSFDFSESLNIIKGDNESGKSTLLLFISYMLYGLSRSSRKNSPDAYDKARSLSWASSRAAGSIEIEDGGKRYRIERENVRRTTSSEAVITDVDTGARVGMGEEPGEVFLGVSKETFESCLWCAQSRTANISGEKLIETLSNLSLTADESVNGEAVLSAIKEAKKQYRYERGNGGLIFENEQRMADAARREREIGTALSGSLADRKRYDELMSEKETADKRLALAEKIKDSVNSIKILGRFGSQRRLKQDIEKEKKRLEEFEKSSGFGDTRPTADDQAALSVALRAVIARRIEFNNASEAAKREPSANVKLAAVAREICGADEAGFCQDIDKKLSAASKMRGLGVVCGVVALGSAIGGALMLSKLLAAAISFGAFAVFAVLSVIALTLSAKKRKAVNSRLREMGADAKDYRSYVAYCFEELEKYTFEKAQIDELVRKRNEARANLDFALNEAEAKLREYGRGGNTPCVERLESLISDVAAYLKAKKAIVDKIAISEKFAERDEEILASYDEQSIRDSLPEGADTRIDIGEYTAMHEYRAASEKCRSIDNELVELKIKIMSTGVDTEAEADIKRERELLAEANTELCDRYEILDKAYKAVEEAYANMRRNFAPSVRDGAGRYVSEISDAKYDRVFLSEDFDVSVDAEGKERNAGCLSRGTSDAVYLALRLSLIENIFEGSVPLFMDESLSALDDTRASRSLSLISKFAEKGNQVLLFSCHRRERELCDKLGIAYNSIDI